MKNVIKLDFRTLDIREIMKIATSKIAITKVNTYLKMMMMN